MSQQEIKQKIIIEISTEYDSDVAQMDYNEFVTMKRTEYNKKGFSYKQAKYFNRTNESRFERLENGCLDCLYIQVKAKVLMSGGHYEEFYDSLGGCYIESRTDLENMVEYYQMIENVKEQIEKEGIKAEYEIVWKE